MKEAIKIKNQIEELEKITNRIDIIAEEWNLKPKDALNINLVIEELITNTIFYGYNDKGEHEIAVDLSLEHDNLSIRIEDDGYEFNPLMVDNNDSIVKPLEERQVGGLGILLVKNLTDKANYQRIDNRNIIILEKKLGD